MKSKLAKLIDVKSIVTLLLVFIFCYLAVVGRVTSQDFMTVFVIVIGFYFGTQTPKGTPTKED
jgi:hypothetical protein